LASVFAHELRNALSPARAALELLQRREAGNEALQPVLRTMDRSFVVALQTIDRFVDAQRILDGTVKLQIAPLELTSIIEQAIAVARPTLAERGQRVTKNLDGDPVVVTDSTRSAQVVAQLIENASVNAPDGAAIEIEACARGERVDVIVREPAPREQGFDVADALSAMRAPPHTRGLALATARRLMTLQHGSLDARINGESRRAEFVVSMPQSSAPAVAAATQSQPESTPQAQSEPSALDRVLASEPSARAPQRILLVDDNQAVRTVYREALEELGYDVTLASNGEDALRAVEGSVPEVALIDVHLPTLNGYQLARALRARHPSSGIKLIMLSGMTLDDDMIRLSKNAGFDHCIDKGAGPKAIDTLLRP
jgi:CheY-like chemotaxis protein